MDGAIEFPLNDKAYNELIALAMGLSKYENTYGVLPNNRQGLKYLADPAVDILKHIPSDPWGQEYVYLPYKKGAAFVLYSEGSIINSSIPVILTFRNNGGGYQKTDHYLN